MTQMSTNKWMDKLCYNHTLVNKKKLIPDTCYTTWVELEKSQTQKDKYYVVPVIWNILNRYIYRKGTQIGGCQGLGQGEGERMGSNCLMGAKFPFGVMKNILARQMVIAQHHCKYIKCHWIVHFYHGLILCQFHLMVLRNQQYSKPKIKISSMSCHS